MDLVGLDALAQRGIHQLVTRNGALALESGRYDHGKPVATITLDFEVVTRQAGGKKGTQFVSSHHGV